MSWIFIVLDYRLLLSYYSVLGPNPTHLFSFSQISNNICIDVHEVEEIRWWWWYNGVFLVIQVGFRAWATYTMNTNLGEHSANFYIYQMMILIFNTWIQELQGTADDKSFPVMSQNMRPLGSICSFIFRTHFKWIYFSFSPEQNSKSKRRIALQKTELVYGLSRSPFRRFGRGTGRRVVEAPKKKAPRTGALGAF